MNFAWIFAIIAGAAIIFLAIYAATQYVKTQQYNLDIQTANKLAILIDPLETSLESGKSSVISFSSKARIYNDKCESYGNFGQQSLGVTVSGVGEWKEPAYAAPVYNKYIFSDNMEQGKDFSILLKPLNMPFKITDLIIFSSEEYCFVDAPYDVEDEIEDLLKNVSFVENKRDCENVEVVCFSRGDCDINVIGNLETGYVSKQGGELYYTENLLYAAIFSSQETYECNVKRLMLRLVNLALIYKDKVKVLGEQGCNSLLDVELNELIAVARNLKSSRDLNKVQKKSKEIDIINNAASCKLW